MKARHFLLRAVRGGPLVPARLWFCNHEPGVPENRLDRGRLSLYPRADIAGVEVEPEQLADRLFSMTDPRPAHPPTHWRYTKQISEAEYRWRLDSMHWAEQHQPDHPGLQPRRAVDPRQMPLPSFARENAI